MCAERKETKLKISLTHGNQVNPPEKYKEKKIKHDRNT